MQPVANQNTPLANTLGKTEDSGRSEVPPERCSHIRPSSCRGRPGLTDVDRTRKKGLQASAQDHLRRTFASSD